MVFSASIIAGRAGGGAGVAEGPMERDARSGYEVGAVQVGMDVYRRYTRRPLGKVTELEATRFNVRSGTGVERWIAMSDVQRVASNRVIVSRPDESVRGLPPA
jgi:hypothetical protein